MATHSVAFYILTTDFIKAVVTQIKKAALPLQRLFEILIKGIIYGSDHPECISVLRTW